MDSFRPFIKNDLDHLENEFPATYFRILKHYKQTPAGHTQPGDFLLITMAETGRPVTAFGPAWSRTPVACIILSSEEYGVYGQKLTFLWDSKMWTMFINQETVFYVSSIGEV